MATLTVQAPGLASAATPATQELSAADVFPATSSEKFLLVITGATAGSITATIDDPNSSGPAAAKAFNPDVDMTVPQAVRRVFLIAGASRFRQADGTISLSTSGTPAGSNIEIYAV